MTDADEVLPGGGMSTVLRRGQTVVRETGPWTPRVHELLRHLETTGFGPAPRLVGLDGDHEVLTFLAGEVAHPPVTPELVSDAAVADAGVMLRRLHDATTELAARSGMRTGWRFDAIDPVEVICHNDFAPYNVVFVDGRPAGVIDFDTARPGPRLWDLGYAVFSWAPLERRTPSAAAEQWRRVELFCAAYGTGTDGVLAAVQGRLIDMITMIENHPDFHRQRAEEHDVYYRDCLEHVRTTVAAVADELS